MVNYFKHSGESFIIKTNVVLPSGVEPDDVIIALSKNRHADKIYSLSGGTLVKDASNSYFSAAVSSADSSQLMGIYEIELKVIFGDNTSIKTLGLINFCLLGISSVGPSSTGTDIENIEIELDGELETLAGVSRAWVERAIAEAALDGTGISLSSYYTKSEVEELLLSKVSSSSLAAVATTGSYNDLRNKPTIPSIEGLASINFVNQAIAAIPSTDLSSYYDKDQIDSLIDSIDFSPYCKKSELEEIILDTVDFSDYYTKSETYSKSEVERLIAEASIGSGTDTSLLYTKSEVDTLLSAKADASSTYTKSEVDDLIEGIGTSAGITEDMIAYLESKLTYTYGYTYTITAPQNSIDLPTQAASVQFTANFSVSKSNDAGSKPVSVSSVSVSTSGWSGSGSTYTKSVSINAANTSVSSGSISASVTNSDGKTGTATGSSKTVTFTKPWFIFCTNSGTLSNPAQTVKDLISGSLSNIESARTALSEDSHTITATGDYVWFAIPNTRTLNKVDQLAGISSLESTTPKYSPSDTGLGTYSIYRWKGALAPGSLTFNIKIS